MGKSTLDSYYGNAGEQPRSHADYQREREYDELEGALGAEAARLDSKNGVIMRSRQYMTSNFCSLSYIDGYEQTYLMIINKRRGKHQPPLTLAQIHRQ